MSAWASIEDAHQHWPDSAQLADARLNDLLDATFPGCRDYAPALADTDPVPDAYMIANIMQARDVYEAQQRKEGDVIGVGEYAIRARPLTATVKQLLRPQRGRPGIG